MVVDGFLINEDADDSEMLSSDADPGEKGVCSWLSDLVGENMDFWLVLVGGSEEGDHVGENCNGDCISTLDRIYGKQHNNIVHIP